MHQPSGKQAPAGCGPVVADIDLFGGIPWNDETYTTVGAYLVAQDLAVNCRGRTGRIWTTKWYMDQPLMELQMTHVEIELAGQETWDPLATPTPVRRSIAKPADGVARKLFSDPNDGVHLWDEEPVMTAPYTDGGKNRTRTAADEGHDLVLLDEPASGDRREAKKPKTVPVTPQG